MCKILYVPEGRYISFTKEGIQKEYTSSIEESVLWDSYISKYHHGTEDPIKGFLKWLFIDADKFDYNCSFYTRNNLKYADNLSLPMFELIYA